MVIACLHNSSVNGLPCGADNVPIKQTRDAPIIGRLLCRYRPIVIYYVLNGRHKFCSIVIYANLVNMLIVSVVYYALDY